MTVLFMRPGRIATALAWILFVLAAVPIALLALYSAFAGTRR